MAVAKELSCKAAWIIADKMIVYETVAKAAKLLRIQSSLHLMFPESRTKNKQIYRSKKMSKTEQNIFTFLKL